jgi:hypothetical protein
VGRNMRFHPASPCSIRDPLAPMEYEKPTRFSEVVTFRDWMPIQFPRLEPIRTVYPAISSWHIAYL